MPRPTHDPAAAAQLQAAITGLGTCINVRRVEAPSKQEGLGWKYRQWCHYAIEGSDGSPPVAFLVVAEYPTSYVQVTLPDGRVGMQLWETSQNGLQKYLGYRPDGEEVAVDFEMEATAICTGTMTPDVALTASKGGAKLLRLKSPPHYWVFPFILATFCLGAICVNCCTGNVYFHIHTGDSKQRCGSVLRVGGCGGCCPGKQFQVVADDPAVACQALLAFGKMIWLQHFARNQGGGVV